ncbi:MAG: class I SAM-dependent methyltransferase [Planctomycetota bacterium]
MSTPKWSDFYTKVGSGPRPTLVAGLEYYDRDPAEKLAIDVGCGTGRDTIALLEAGFAVFAFDREREAIDRTLAATAPELRSQLATAAVDFASVEIPPCDYVNASLSLFFAAPADFARLWPQLSDRLAADGIFSGHFLGPNDEWLRSGATLTAHGKAELLQLFEDFEMIELQERDEVGPQASGPDKHWHLYSVVARKRGP